MLTLKDYLELIDYKITEGSEWRANLDNTYCLTSWNGEQYGYSLNCVFSTKDQEVFLVEVCDYKNNRAYCLRDSQLTRDDTAWDGVKFIELDTDHDFLQKAKAIIRGVPYDTRVEVELDLPESMLYELMQQAHQQDTTLNLLVENIIRQEINRES